ncbi:LYR motif-containing protein 2 [Lycorma delicatula]|uniref:LYR motif-containing protein 2 n=1 Tax=Lycorma delicatula TaxID=130591 RepID=UPI003F512854
MPGVSKTTMNLKQFLLRQQVLKLYRDILRTVKDVPDENDRKYLREWAKKDFKNNAHQTDEYAIKMLIKYGEKSLNELKQSLELSHATT